MDEAQSFEIRSELWPALIDALQSTEIEVAQRLALVSAGLLDADGRNLTPVVAKGLGGLVDCRSTISVRTADSATVSDSDVFVGRIDSTVLVTAGAQLTVRPVPSAVVPVLIARLLKIGPRPVAPLAEPVVVRAGLMRALTAGDYRNVLAVTAAVVESFALVSPGVADAVEAGRWRFSLLQVTSEDLLVEAMVLLDTSAGLFVASCDEEEFSLFPIATGDLWIRLSEVVTLDEGGRVPFLVAAASDERLSLDDARLAPDED
jgi:hypothetical protein